MCSTDAKLRVLVAQAESSVQAKPKHVLRREERERAARQYEIAALASSSLVIATAIWATWARLT